MDITERNAGAVTIVDLKGRLDMGIATQRLHDKINSLLHQERKQILLNLSDVTNMDSGGLGELARTLTTTLRHGGSVKVSNLPKKIHGLLVVTRLVTVFDVFDSEADAIKSFQ